MRHVANREHLVNALFFFFFFKTKAMCTLGLKRKKKKKKKRKEKKDFLFPHFPGSDHILILASEIYFQYNVLVDPWWSLQKSY